MINKCIILRVFPVLYSDMDHDDIMDVAIIIDNILAIEDISGYGAIAKSEINLGGTSYYSMDTMEELIKEIYND